MDALLKNSLIISWKAPKDDGGSMITNYIVEKREAKEGELWNLVSSSVSGTTVRVPNVTENAGYYFRVSAQNQYGVSESLEIPSVVIVKSPFGRSTRVSFVLVLASPHMERSPINAERISWCCSSLPRQAWHPTAALHHQLQQRLLCGVLEGSKQ